MFRTTVVFCLLALLARAQEAPAPSGGKQLIESPVRVGDRYTGRNTVSFKIKTVVRQGEKETTTEESMQRTEHFLDTVLRSGDDAVTEIKRTYMLLFTKVKSSDQDRPTVFQSPMQGRTVLIRERRRRRDIQLEGRGSVDPIVRRIVGMEMDWRDIFPDHPVGVGDSWDGDSVALARRLAAYLSCGTRTRMKVRWEELLDKDGTKLAKLYIDWSVEGMRDRHLYTKVNLAGDVYYDFGLKRVTRVDIVGNMIVRGAILGRGAPQIVKGQGHVTVKTEVKRAPIEAAAEDDAAADEE